VLVKKSRQTSKGETVVADNSNIDDAQAYQQPPEPSPHLKSLGRLVGTWNVSGPEIHGRIIFEWMEGGFFLIHRIDFDHAGRRVKGIEIIGHERRFGAEPRYPEVLVGMGQMDPEAAEPMKQTPMYQLYASVAPKPEDWSVLLTKLGELLRQDYDWSEDVAAIEAPTMIVIGDADSVRTAHAVGFFELLGGGKEGAGWDGSRMSKARLAILPATTHYNIFFSPTLASTVTPFLDAPMPEAE
jgi:pimeloyl-ACP methyl ester carboxylesterase